MEQQSKIRFLVNLSYALSVGLIIYFCAKFLVGYFLPFVVASVIAWSVQKPAKKIADKTKIKRGACAVFLSLIIFIITASFIFFSMYKGLTFIGETLNKIPEIIDTISGLFEDLKERLVNFNYDLSPKTLGTLSGIEIGENFVTAETLDKIVKALNTTSEELFATSHLKEEDELIEEIEQNIKTISKNPAKLDILYNVTKSLIKE